VSDTLPPGPPAVVLPAFDAVLESESIPSLDSVLRLGQELVAHLWDEIAPRRVRNEETETTQWTNELLVRACQCARGNPAVGPDVVSEVLRKIEANRRWPSVRMELRFVRDRLRAEPLPGGGEQGTGGPAAPTTTGAGRDEGGPSAPASEIAGDETPPSWSDLGDAKRAILTVLGKATERLDGQALAKKAGYKYGSLRHHVGDLQRYRYIDRTKDGYAITPSGSALVPCDRV
jgi:hypothetical protein